jgi:hypothetical protein
VELHDGGIGWQPVLINSESGRVGEVVTELSVELEDVAIVGVADNWNLSL